VSLDNKTVLVVEDDPALNFSLTAKLKKEGFETISADNGIDGLEKALHNKPDLIVLDILMAKMDGFAMMERLRQDAWGKDVPVIIVTNLIEEHFHDKAKQYNIASVLVKTNNDLNSIMGKIKEALS
jgi:CheY-like chemotaxis protein